MKYLKKFYGKTTIDDSDSYECNDLQNADVIELEYYEIKSSTSNKPYGVEVVKKTMQDEQLNMENKVINNIYDKEQDNKKLLELLITNKVTPISVEDIIQDLMKKEAI